MTGPAGTGLRPSVILMPHYPGNPYTGLLTGSLEERGVEIQGLGISGWLPLFRAVRVRGKPDLIHLQWQHRFFLKEDEGALRAGIRTILFFVQWMVLRVAGVRFVWTVHNLVNHERRLATLELTASRLLAGLVDGIIVHCEAAALAVREAYRISGRKIRVIPHGHYIDAYPDPPERARAREQLELPAARRILLHFGQIRPYKGVEDLIAAFRRIDAEDLLLVIAGQPRFEWLDERIRRLAREHPRIRLDLRYVPDDELTSYLSAADAVVLPYTDLLTSGSAVLAASYGRAVIAPAVGCLRGFPEGTIIRYPAGDENGLEEALEASRSAPLDDMGRDARTFIAGFGWQAIADATRLAYENRMPGEAGGRP